MQRPLLISGLLEHAATLHGDRQIVSCAPEEQVSRLLPRDCRAGKATRRRVAKSRRGSGGSDCDARLQHPPPAERPCHVAVMTDRAHMPAGLPRRCLARGATKSCWLGATVISKGWPDFDENTAAAHCYTSGTTGNPKGVLYSHRSQILHAFAVAPPDEIGSHPRGSYRDLTGAIRDQGALTLIRLVFSRLPASQGQASLAATFSTASWRRRSG